MVKDEDWHIWSSYPRMRSVKSFLEHSAKDASFLLKNQQSQWTDAFLYRDHDEFYRANRLFHLGVVVVVLLWEIISAGRELAGRRQVILRAASTCPLVNNTTVPTILCCPPKLSSPSHAIQLNCGGAAWCAPETVSLLRTALGISWTSHWTPLLPPGITIWKCWEKAWQNVPLTSERLKPWMASQETSCCIKEIILLTKWEQLQAYFSVCVGGARQLAGCW